MKSPTIPDSDQTAFDKSCCPNVVMTVSYPVSEILLKTANSLMSLKIQKP